MKMQKKKKQAGKKWHHRMVDLQHQTRNKFVNEQLANQGQEKLRKDLKRQDNWRDKRMLSANKSSILFHFFILQNFIFHIGT